MSPIIHTWRINFPIADNRLQINNNPRYIESEYDCTRTTDVS
jgi:hypothetical protein